MYSDLSRCDMLAKSGDGETIAVQTDHRTAKEIDSDKERNTIIAIQRTLSAASQKPSRILFTFKENPPGWYLKLIGATAKYVGVRAFYMVNRGKERSVPKPLFKSNLTKEINKVMDKLSQNATGQLDHDKKLIEQLFKQAKETGRREIAIIDSAAVASKILKRTMGVGEWIIKDYRIMWYIKGEQETWVYFFKKAEEILDEEDELEGFFHLISLASQEK